MELLHAAEVDLRRMPECRGMKLGARLRLQRDFRWSQEDLGSLATFFDRAAASKFAVHPTRSNEVLFLADARKVTAARAYRPPFISVGIVDFAYMPMAWRGDAEGWAEQYRWFTDLPIGTRRLPAVGRA